MVEMTLPVGVEVTSDGAEKATLEFDGQLYSDDVVFNVCHRFTGRCDLFVDRKTPGRLRVVFTRRNNADSLASVVSEFGNELINQRVRESVARETSVIREIIVRQAFAEADFRFQADSL